MKSLATAFSFALTLLAGAAPAQTTPVPDAAAVVKALESGDCAVAAKTLNAALAQPSPQVLLLAGSMFEQGLCFKANVERAARFYLRAQEQPSAPARLAALYASPAAGPDKGLAMWWGLRAGLPIPRECDVPGEARQDPDRFGAAVAGWRPERLNACVHVIGVLATVGAEFVTASVVGDGLPVGFTPASGQWLVATDQLAQEGIDAGVGAGAIRGSAPGFQRAESWAQPDTSRARSREELRAMAPRVERLGRDALARFPRPEGIDPGWRLNFSITEPRR
ncbi:MAG TPA: hypothetical protein VIN03_07320 [Roseateles sp.]